MPHVPQCKASGSSDEDGDDYDELYSMTTHDPSTPSTSKKGKASGNVDAQPSDRKRWLHQQLIKPTIFFERPLFLRCLSSADFFLASCRSFFTFVSNKHSISFDTMEGPILFETTRTFPGCIHEYEVHQHDSVESSMRNARLESMHV